MEKRKLLRLICPRRNQNSMVISSVVLVRFHRSKSTTSIEAPSPLSLVKVKSLLAHATPSKRSASELMVPAKLKSKFC